MGKRKGTNNNLNTADPKTPNVYKVDQKGKEVSAKDGIVKINIARHMFKKNWKTTTSNLIAKGVLRGQKWSH
jgi:hypothetical protein